MGLHWILNPPTRGEVVVRMKEKKWVTRHYEHAPRKPMLLRQKMKKRTFKPFPVVLGSLAEEMLANVDVRSEWTQQFPSLMAVNRLQGSAEPFRYFEREEVVAALGAE